MILLLSDLHLPNRPSPLREGFLRFLAGPARQAEAVYLLGDLFEYWIGDDVGLTEYGAEVQALHELTDRGVAVYFIAGNRDFLVGARFFAASGVQALPDPTVRTLDGVKTLLAHGDLYCSDDLEYQRWRRFSRNPLAQRLFMWLPRSLRARIAGGLRVQSHGAKTQKPAMIMDVKADSIEQALRDAGVKRLIHGHTHRPCDHTITLDGDPAERIVLSDWSVERMEYLAVDGQRHRRVLL